MKKAIIIFLLAVITASFVFSGCSDSNENRLAGTDVRIGEKIISLNEDMESVKGKIGGAESEDSAVSCLYDGNDKVFYYEGLRVNTYPSGSRDLVSSIVIDSPEFEISNGVKVGDSIADAKGKTEGTPDRENEFYTSYEYGSYGVTYYIRDSVITEIEIYKTNS